ncbi:unnamed protein product [Orchesella dallaii]|uniref:F-box domain-containing protein n=1 Tax=Orchesella dallaii TaxID=48710 RepID=A0ABP1RYG5_9HEXA
MDLVTPKAPEEILPLEVWGMILDHLRSPSDLLNCNKVCKAWRKLLELKKTTFLMPKVFPILYKYMETIEDEDERQLDENEETVNTTILKIRLVSHGWKESVDNFHQNYPTLNNIGFMALKEEEYLEDVDPFSLLGYGFRGREPVTRMENFLRKGFSPDSNPFITRCIRYYDHHYINQHQSNSQTAFKNILEAFGSHIWTCVLQLTIDTTNADFYKFVRSYLNLMPNLRSFRLEFLGPENSLKRKRNLEKEDLELLLKNEPLPRLEHLTTLRMSNVPYPLSVGLLANNGHLQKLSFRSAIRNNPKAFLPDCIANLKLPTLMQLEFPCNEKRLLSFPKISWPITVLYLNVEAAKLKNVFQVVASHFSNTLEHLALRYDTTIKNSKEMKQTRLDLPKLRTFQLEVIPLEVETIDFLQGCTALQEIQLAFYVYAKDKETDKHSSSRVSMDGDEDDNAGLSTDEEDNSGLSTDEEDNAGLSRDEEDNSGLSTDEEDNSGLSTDEEDNAGLSTDEEDNPGLSTDEEDNAVIQFKDCITSMNQSNIWRILDKLQCIKFKINGIEDDVSYRIHDFTRYPGQIHKFTRRQFEKFSNTN